MYNTEVLSQDHLSPSVPTVELCSLLSEIISISEMKSVSVKIPDNCKYIRVCAYSSADYTSVCLYKNDTVKKEEEIQTYLKTDTKD